MTWHWYIARSNEIFCDLDSMISARHAIDRLRRTLARKELKVQSAYLFSSASRNKFHMVLVLDENLPALLRAEWAWWFGSDPVRAIYTMERLRRGLKGADLLIVSKPYNAGFRAADATCDCPEKHKSLRITNHCPVMQSLHGDESGAEYFPRNNDRKRKRKGLRLTVNARIPLSRILKS